MTFIYIGRAISSIVNDLFKPICTNKFNGQKREAREKRVRQVANC